MGLLIVDHRQLWNEADSTTGWAGGTPTLFTADPDPIESTGHIGVVVSTATVDSYYVSASTDLSNKVIYVWQLPRGAMDNILNGGQGIYLSDGTDAVSFHIAGSDISGFRHDKGPVPWQCVVLDTSFLPINTTRLGGGSSSLGITAITGVGSTFKTLAKSTGGVSNCFTDVIRIFNPSINGGVAISYYSGSEIDPISFFSCSLLDRSTGNGQGYGIVRELGSGVYGIQGALAIGDITNRTLTYFKDTNVSITFESRSLSTTRYKILGTGSITNPTTIIFGNKVGSGTSATGQDGCSIVSNIGMELDFSISQSVISKIYGSTLSGISRGIKLNAGCEFIGNVVNSSGTIFPSGAICVNNNINPTIASSSLFWNGNFDTNGLLNGCNFLGSVGGGHGIELGPTIPNTMSFQDITFTNFGLDGSNSASLYNNSGKSIMINILGTGNTPTVRNGTGASTNVIAGQKTFTVNGAKSGSEIRIISGGNELFGTENATGVDPSLQYVYTYPGYDQLVDVVVHALDYEYLLIESVSLPNSDSSLLVQQSLDRNYENP